MTALNAELAEMTEKMLVCSKDLAQTESTRRETEKKVAEL
jgi:hypothetical protein